MALIMIIPIIQMERLRPERLSKLAKVFAPESSLF